MSPQLDGSYAATIPYTFQCGADGAFPRAGLLLGSGGNLYGATEFGGAVTRACSDGCGTIFRLTPDGTKTTLHSFGGPGDGNSPISALVTDGASLFGALLKGGDGPASGNGLVFRQTLAAPGGGAPSYDVLHRFSFRGPYEPASVLVAPDGTLYGATIGSPSFLPRFIPTAGIVFQMTPPTAGRPAWFEKPIAYFDENQRGGIPIGNLVMDAAGDMFGTTQFGGARVRSRSADGGVVYQMHAPVPPRRQWTRSVLYRFNKPTDPLHSVSGLVLDEAGNLYGTAPDGGAYGHGAVYELSPGFGGYTLTILYSFRGFPEGERPLGGLLRDASGALYGTTFAGGTANAGIVYRVTP